MKNDLIYDVGDKVPFGKNLLFALQQFLAIIAATILVPILADKSGVYLSQSAALIGAGVGTIVYLLFTRFRSPVFLGSSFAFITPLMTAVLYGYFGIILGSVFAGLVYVILALVIKFCGSGWTNKIMPPITIGPVVALIGFDLASSAIANLMNTAVSADNYNLVSILVGLVTFMIVVISSVNPFSYIVHARFVPTRQMISTRHRNHSLRIVRSWRTIIDSCTRYDTGAGLCLAQSSQFSLQLDSISYL